MQEAVVTATSFLGGLFFGYIAAVLAFFVGMIIKQAFDEPRDFLIPAVVLLSLFGTALVYVLAVIFGNMAILVGAAITFAHGIRPLFASDEDTPESSKKRHQNEKGHHEDGLIIFIPLIYKGNLVPER